MKIVKKSEVRKIRASPTSLPYKGVLHTVAPRWDKHAVKDNKTFEKQLKLTICNIVQHCSDSGTVNSVAIPVLGIDKGQTIISTVIFVISS
jgi:O-acetyl-ADP-ribose deacetylase (regulator of RNase III)